MKLNDSITIEKFAAFLDGNLSEQEMSSVATAIDSTDAYTDILGEVMQVDDIVDTYMNRLDTFPDVYMDVEFELPIVPEMSDSSVSVELTSVEDTETDTVELVKENVSIAEASNHDENIVSDMCHREIAAEATVSDEIFDMEPPTEEIYDDFDLA